MSKKIIVPCTQGIKCFDKSGCPEKVFERASGEGCPAWKEYTIPADGEHVKPIILKGCAHLLKEHWAFEALKLIEGNQRATESLRNGMCEQDPNGHVVPKTNRDILALAAVINKEHQTLKAFIKSGNILEIGTD